MKKKLQQYGTKALFSKNDLIKDDCGCIYQILKKGIKYYTCRHIEDEEGFHWKIEIKKLDKRGLRIGDVYDSKM